MLKFTNHALSFATLLLSFHFLPATAGTFSFDFLNTNYITIMDSGAPPTKAGLYPSVINVSGLSNLFVTDVTVTLSNFSHTFPSDVSMLLVGPQAQEAILLSQVGGADTAYPVSNVVLSLNDRDPDPLPVHDPLFSGSFRPTVLESPQPFSFPPPAPTNNPSAPASLSVFYGTDPNGPWKLYIVDGAAGDDGSLSGGWSLSLTASVVLQETLKGTNLVFSWPAVTNGAYSLQFTPHLANSNAWSNITASPLLLSNLYVVTNALPKAANSGFYRLNGQ